MYRLLIVTDSQNVHDRVQAMTGWENLGCKPPRIRANQAEMIDCMKKHSIDAIAFVPETEGSLDSAVQYVEENYPLLPIFAVAETEEEQMKYITEVSMLLDHLRADHTNRDCDKEVRFWRMRNHFIKRVICGTIPSAQKLERLKSLYRCNISSDSYCYMADFVLQEDDDFINERWHYGSDRLSVALRNFFSDAYQNANILVVVLSDMEICVFFYPNATGEELNEQEIIQYINKVNADIHNYLGLNMKLVGVARTNGLLDFINASQPA